MTEVYWFAAYVDPGEAGLLELIPNPDHGAYFADDSVPSVQDPTAGLGAMGFHLAGFTPCPGGTGACCTPTGECFLLPLDVCDQLGGDYLGDGVTCEPSTCLSTSVGACCFEELCLLLTETGCGGEGGVWMNGAPECAPNPCSATPRVETTWGRVKSLFRR
ncbi:MAG: hypothetical protein R3E97_14845 [Candidatus Eisenbacteria bacterium]